MVAKLGEKPGGEDLPVTIGVRPTRLLFDEYDTASQTVISHHFWKDGETFASSSAPYRYVWPSELDLMARLAGLRLRHRWGGWTREPFTADSTLCVSVWEETSAPVPGLRRARAAGR